VIWNTYHEGILTRLRNLRKPKVKLPKSGRLKKECPLENCGGMLIRRGDPAKRLVDLYPGIRL